jgi:hypothetical protein
MSTEVSICVILSYNVLCGRWKSKISNKLALLLVVPETSPGGAPPPPDPVEAFSEWSVGKQHRSLYRYPILCRKFLNMLGSCKIFFPFLCFYEVWRKPCRTAVRMWDWTWPLCAIVVSSVATALVATRLGEGEREGRKIIASSWSAWQGTKCYLLFPSQFSHGTTILLSRK